MFLENTWNIITTWFKDHSERTRLIREFNEKSKQSFIMGITPTVLKASVSRGLPANRHQFSSWLNTGFRIQALSGRELSKNEMECIGMVILSDTSLVRHLIVLGWDTLEVHDNKGCYGCRWCLTNYANIGKFIE